MTNIILLIAAVIVLMLVFTWLLRVVKATIATGITIFLIIVVLGFLGLGPDRLIQEVIRIPQSLWHLVTGK